MVVAGIPLTVVDDDCVVVDVEPLVVEVDEFESDDVDVEFEAVVAVDALDGVDEPELGAPVDDEAVPADEDGLVARDELVSSMVDVLSAASGVVSAISGVVGWSETCSSAAPTTCQARMVVRAVAATQAMISPIRVIPT